MARPKLSNDPVFRVTVAAEEKVVEEFDDVCRALALSRSEVMRRLMRQLEAPLPSRWARTSSVRRARATMAS